MSPSALPPGCSGQGAGVGPATDFYFVTAAGAFLPVSAFSAVASCLHGSCGSHHPGRNNIGQAVSQH